MKKNHDLVTDADEDVEAEDIEEEKIKPVIMSKILEEIFNDHDQFKNWMNKFQVEITRYKKTIENWLSVLKQLMKLILQWAILQSSQAVLRRNDKRLKINIVIKNLYFAHAIKLNEYLESLELSNINQVLNAYNKPKAYHTGVYCVNEERKAHLIKNSLKLGNINHHVEEYKKPLKVNQCFKSQEFGHCSFTCNKEQVCVKFKGNLFAKDCKSKVFKCANCDGSHAANSRKCSHFQATSNHFEIPERVSLG
jgi:hypothetical protein